VIFLLGDGMDTQEITAARFHWGVNNPLNVDRMRFTGFDTTWSVKPGAAAPYLPDYDPDSASTGSAWATLSLTYGTAGYEAGKAPAAVPPSQPLTGPVVPVWAAGPGGLAVLGTNHHPDMFTALSGH
jgi:alkaline phosphatase